MFALLILAWSIILKHKKHILFRQYHMLMYVRNSSKKQKYLIVKLACTSSCERSLYCCCRCSGCINMCDVLITRLPASPNQAARGSHERPASRASPPKFKPINMWDCPYFFVLTMNMPSANRSLARHVILVPLALVLLYSWDSVAPSWQHALSLPASTTCTASSSSPTSRNLLARLSALSSTRRSTAFWLFSSHRQLRNPGAPAPRNSGVPSLSTCEHPDNPE
jgi:hypothetical protein